ncbi:FAD-dependent oxidoreductase, partial [Oxalobacteraceae bacterium OM1]
MRLRCATPAMRVSNARCRMVDVVVVGGGLAGLACAVALADKGMRVTVLERHERLGGRAGCWRDEVTGDMVDIGPHVVHSEYRNMLAFLERLGSRERITWQPRKVLSLATRPHLTRLKHWPLPPPLSLFPSLLAAPGLSLRDYVSMWRTTWWAMRFGEEDIAALDRLNALDFLRSQKVSKRMLEWWWAFAAMVVTNVPLERCSAAALMRIHAQLSGHRGLHFGFAAVGLAELYADQAVRVIEAAGGEVRLRAGVRRFIGNGRIEGVELEDGSQVRAAHCISAVPPGDLQMLLSPEQRRQAPFQQLGAFEPSPYISVYLWFDRALRVERFTSHLWSPERLNYDYYDLRQIRTGWSGRPSIMASNIIYSHRAEGLRDDAVIAATVRELAEFAPDAAAARIVHARVHRIPMAIPCPLPGSEEKRPPARTPLPGLLLAGDWTRTHLPCSMESAVRS